MSLAPRLDMPANNEITYPDLPANIEVEQALLGALISANGLIAEVRTVCEPDDFSDPLHRRIADTIFRLDFEQRPTTPLTLRTALHGDVGFDELPSGFAYLDHLVDASPVTDRRHILQLGKDVADLRTRRDAMMAIWEAQEELSLPPRRAIVEILKPVVTASDKAAERAEGAKGSTAASVTALALVKPPDEAAELLGTPVPTGLRKLDKILGGLYPGNLIILAGRTGMGKSTAATNLARAAAERGTRVEYFSPEMSKAQLVARLITDMDFDRYDRDGLTKPLSYSRLLKRRCKDAEMERAANMAELMASLQINIHDQDSPTIGDIAALARAAAAQHDGPGLVIIDHLHIVRPTERYRGNRVAEITEITGTAKALAKRLKWPVVLLSQLNREVEKKPEKERRPQLSDLRDSGSIEQDADVVVFLHRPAYYVERRKPALGSRDPDWTTWLRDYEVVRNHVDVDVAKNRDGEVDVFKAFVEIGACAIRDSDPDLPPPAADPDESEGLLL
jgi:replicative DNA helicase